MASVQEDSPGKSLLKVLREKRQQEEAQANHEFSMAARQNFEHGKQVRDKMVHQSRTGENGKGGIFANQSSNQRKLPPRSGPSILSHVGQEHEYDQPQRAKENFRLQQPTYEQEDYQHRHQGANRSPRGVQKDDNCAMKYDAMLAAAQNKRTREKFTPRPTNFY